MRNELSGSVIATQPQPLASRAAAGSTLAHPLLEKRLLVIVSGVGSAGLRHLASSATPEGMGDTIHPLQDCRTGRLRTLFLWLAVNDRLYLGEISKQPLLRADIPLTISATRGEKTVVHFAGVIVHTTRRVLTGVFVRTAEQAWS